MQTQEELNLYEKNKNDGIATYIDTQNRRYGKLYMTPRGPYQVLKRVEEDFGLYRKTILRRFKSKRASLSDWFVIEGETPLQPEEDCKFCDDIDDRLFSDGCWLVKVHHTHDTRPEDSDMIDYLFKGNQYSISVQDLKNENYPHLN